MQRAFYSNINQFCLHWATPLPRSTTTYGGPLRTDAPEFPQQLRGHAEAIFEQLLLFDEINFNVSGPNLIAPLMYNFMGADALEEFLEQRALSFVVWQPVPMMTTQDGRVAATFVGRIGDGHGSELDIEKIVEEGLRLHPTNMSLRYKKQLRRKLVGAHTLLDEGLPAAAWQTLEHALKNGALEHIGLTAEEPPIGLPVQKGKVLGEAVDSLLYYKYILSNGMASYGNEAVFSLFNFDADASENTKRSPTEKFATIAEFENFPDLRSLFTEIETPFESIARFRGSHTATKFREWLSVATETSSAAELLREYVDACAKRRGLFESAPAKFVKLATMIAISHFAGFEATAAAAMALTAAPEHFLNEAVSAVTDFGTGIFDSFLIDKIKIGWTPKAYFNGLRRVRRTSRQSSD
jgi:hypothetical protein